MSKPVLYSAGCPKCSVLAKKLDAANIEYEVNTDTDSIMTLCEYLGAATLPILEVQGTYLDFSKAIKWVGEQANAN